MLISSIDLFPQIHLEDAYKSKSKKKLLRILDEWSDNSVPLERERLENPFLFEKYTYEIFEDFYTPKSISRIGASEWGEEIYKHIKYAFIQDTVYIEIHDSLGSSEFFWSKNHEPNMTFTMINFRPQVNVPGCKVIYLTKSIEEELKTFLGSNYNKLGDGNIMNPASARDESQKKLNFMNQYTQIFHGHWGGYWQMVTYPLVYICFNKDFSKANVQFRLIYEGGLANYERIEGKWKLIKSSLTWVE